MKDTVADGELAEPDAELPESARQGRLVAIHFGTRQEPLVLTRPPGGMGGPDPRRHRVHTPKSRQVRSDRRGSVGLRLVTRRSANRWPSS